MYWWRANSSDRWSIVILRKRGLGESPDELWGHCPFRSAHDYSPPNGPIKIGEYIRIEAPSRGVGVNFLSGYTYQPQLSPNRPPSCDKLKPMLKECPACAKRNLQQNDEFVACIDCGLWGPENDPHGHRWNSIPRRSEVAELLRLVNSVIDTPDWTRQDEIEELIRQADKLRKEWKL